MKIHLNKLANPYFFLNNMAPRAGFFAFGTGKAALFAPICANLFPIYFDQLYHNSFLLYM